MAIITNRIFKTVILQPGEAFTLPPDGEIVFTSDSLGLDSDCEIPQTEPYQCYRLSFGTSETGGSDAALEGDGTPTPTINYIEISGSQYDLDIHIGNTVGGAATALATAISGTVPSAIFSIYSVYANFFDRRTEFGIKFRSFPSLVEDMVMKITGVSYGDGLYLIPLLDTDCECYSGADDIYCNNPNT